MADDSLEGMPEFEKPAEEIVPLVVPDITPAKPRCEGTKKDGTPCGTPPLKGEKLCLGHAKSIAPEMRDKWRRIRTGIPRIDKGLPRKNKFYSREDLLDLLSKRLDLVKDRFGDVCNPEVDEMICNIIRTFAAIYKIETAEVDEKAAGWRMKGAV